MSVMNGFRTELIDKIVNINGHILVYPIDNEGIKNFDIIEGEIKKLKFFKKSIPMLEAQILALGDSQSSGGLLRGVPIERLSDIDIISSNIIEGKLTKNNDGVIIGSRLASNLSLNTENNISIMSPRGISSPFGTIPRSYSYDIDAVFDIGMTDYDSSVIFMDLPIAQEFLNLGNVVGVIQIFVDNPEKSILYKGELDKILEEFDVFSRDWSQTNASLQEMLIVERNVMFLIFSLLLIITGINIVSGLIILVKDRSREISILRAMGMTKTSISRLFIITGSKIGFYATLTGLFFGILVSVYVENIRLFIMSIFDITLFNPEIYFLISMPSEIHIPEVITITILSLSLSVVATIYPAIRSVSKDPAEALRNE